MNGGAGARPSGTTRHDQETDMTTPAPGQRIIEISDEAFDVLARTAETQGTDFDGALRYLMQAPAVPAATTSDDDEE
jgi:hypothetical protein